MMILIVIPLWALHINIGELLVAFGQDPIVAKWVTGVNKCLMKFLKLSDLFAEYVLAYNRQCILLNN